MAIAHLSTGDLENPVDFHEKELAIFKLEAALCDTMYPLCLCFIPMSLCYSNRADIFFKLECTAKFLWSEEVLEIDKLYLEFLLLLHVLCRV